MSEYMFGVTHQKLSARECKRRDRICRGEGGYGYTQYDESHGTAEGGRWIGWYSGPNRGEPFDSDLSARVLARIDPPEPTHITDDQIRADIASPPYRRRTDGTVERIR